MFPTYLAVLFLSLCTLHVTSSQPNSCPWVPPVVNRASSGAPLNTVLFTDGSDFPDAVCLIFLAKSPRVNLLAIYVQGNGFASPGSSIRNFFNILHLMGDQFRKVPIFLGSYNSLIDELSVAGMEEPIPKSYSIFVPSGKDGVLYTDTLFGTAQTLPQGPNFYDIRNTPDSDAKSIPALFDLLESLSLSEHFTFLSVGTLTPIAKMFSDVFRNRTENNIIPKVDGLYIGAGAVDVPGNLFTTMRNRKAEYNIHNDPHAAQWAIANFTRLSIPVTLVPLDATGDVPIQPRLLEALLDTPRTPESQLVGILMNNVKDTWYAPELFFETAFIWDVTAAIAMLYEPVVTKKRKRFVRVVIEEGPNGPNQGWTKPCSMEEIRGGYCSEVVVLEELHENKITDLLLDTLQSSENSAQRPLVCL